MWNINKLRHARACPGHPGAIYAGGDGWQERFFWVQSLPPEGYCISFRNVLAGYITPPFMPWAGLKAPPKHSGTGYNPVPAFYIHTVQIKPVGEAPPPTKTVSFLALDCRDPGSSPGEAWPGNDVFYLFINELSNQLLTYTHYTTLTPSYRRKPVSQAIDACICGTRPRLSPG